jgi:HPt (histidine-containing phosphotransfer) domain-containing protein
MTDDTARLLRERLHDLRRDYRARLPELADRIDALRAAARTSDDARAALHQTIHSLAGTSGSLGLSGLSALATDLDVRWQGGVGLDADGPALDRLADRLRADRSTPDDKE